MAIEKADTVAPSLSPDQMVAKLTPAQISGIIIGSLALTLLVFFSGFIVGWLRNKFVSWKNRGASPDSGAAFTKLDTLVTSKETVEL